MTVRHFDLQKNNKLQSDCGLFLSMHGASEQAMVTGMTMGFCPHPRTIFNKKRILAEKSLSLTNEKITEALKVLQ